MRIAVDARTVYGAERRGTGKNLIDLYRRIAALHRDWHFVMFHRRAEVLDDPFAGEPNIVRRYLEVPGDRWDLWQQLRLPQAAWTSRASVLHCPANTSPRFPLIPLVATVHDLIPLDFHEPSDASRRWETRVSYSVRNSRRVITPSAYTKNRLVERYGVPEAKIVVNHWAADTTCHRVEDPVVLDATRQRYGIAAGQPYIFGFGASDPRKNADRVIDAWGSLNSGLRLAIGLLLVGFQGSALERARKRAAALAPEGGWSMMPFAEEGDIAALMSGATAFCYPSRSEGFGLPVLDAFSCGTPVITSTVTSLPEVAGDAAVLVDPEDTAAICHALESILTSADRQSMLRQRGYDRLQSFSWERCAKTAADVLAEAA